MTDERIGKLSTGLCYSFIDGYDKEPFIGTYDEVFNKLNGIEAVGEKAFIARQKPYNKYDVVQKFQFPAWDERGGIIYTDIVAKTKSEAIKEAKRIALRDGHLMVGKGRITFTASVSE